MTSTRDLVRDDANAINKTMAVAPIPAAFRRRIAESSRSNWDFCKLYAEFLQSFGGSPHPIAYVDKTNKPVELSSKAALS